MSTKSNLRVFDALGKLDDLFIEARRTATLVLEHELLQAQIDCIYELTARGMSLREALELVVAACRQAEDDVIAEEERRGAVMNLSEFPEDLEEHVDPHGRKPS